MEEGFFSSFILFWNGLDWNLEDHFVEQRKMEAMIETYDGDELARERIIRFYRPYIINTVSHICKRYLTWSDEESSIGLLAFNRAIDTYDREASRTFQSYAYLLIKRDLINYFQKESKCRHLSFDYESEEDETSATKIEADISIESYNEAEQTEALVYEILELDQQLKQFDIQFQDLEAASPKHKDTRESLSQLADDFVQQPEWVNALLSNKKFPVNSFIKQTRYHPKQIERYRKYIIAHVLIRINPEWTHLSSYITGKTEAEKGEKQ